MYSLYQIYQSNNPVYATYHTLNTDFADTTKLDLILNSPITPYYLVDAYFKQPELFSIQTIKSGISNALEASEALQTHINTSINSSIKDTKADIEKESKPIPKPRKPRTKKVIKNED
ncbi:hypothetical protein V6C59_20100 [Acinetobacter bereziniae]|uniref:hypothetical protein n=1 Tax=Acinetobacter bereziniae TaxID=106648 RepID=UPI002FD976ED